MGAATVFVVLLVTLGTINAKPQQSTLLTRLLGMVEDEGKQTEDVVAIGKREIYYASASRDSIMFFLQTSSPKCRISCSEGATSLQRLRCIYSVTVTNDNDPSEVYRQTKNYWNPRDQQATFQQLQPGQVYHVEACRLAIIEGPTECDQVWCLTQGASMSNDNCSSKKDDMNAIVGSSPFVRNLKLSPEERQKAAIADLNKALERLVEL